MNLNQIRRKAARNGGGDDFPDPVPYVPDPKTHPLHGQRSPGVPFLQRMNRSSRKSMASRKKSPASFHTHTDLVIPDAPPGQRFHKRVDREAVAQAIERTNQEVGGSGNHGQ